MDKIQKITISVINSLRPEMLKTCLSRRSSHLRATSEASCGVSLITVLLLMGTVGVLDAAPPVAARSDGIQSGVVLTFDDQFITQWGSQIPLFKKYDARATFFVTKFHTLNAGQIATLHQLQAAGHAIGCHGVMHRKAVDYVRDHGMQSYLKEEIQPAVKLMTDSGFQPTSFAYPNSSNNAGIDQALSKIFRHQRSGTGLKAGERICNLDQIFVPADKLAGTGCLIGTGIDYAGTAERPDYPEQIKEALDRARKQGEIVVFYAHNISETTKGHHLLPAVLEEILAYAQQIGLPTLTYDDLP